MLYVTNHAVKRTKERVGLPKRLTCKNADRAFEKGLRLGDTRGSLHRYIVSLYKSHENANNVRIYCNNVYIFHNATLITIFPLPQKYRKTVDKLRREKSNG